jgi:hypothetical protein
LVKTHVEESLGANPGDAALDPAAPAILRTVDKSTGDKLGQLELNTTPVWDGIAIANGRLFFTGIDGSIQCFTSP